MNTPNSGPRSDSEMQTASRILMMRPANFSFNDQTAASNPHQQRERGEIQEAAVREFDTAVSMLRNNGVDVEVAEDTATPVKPDAIFLNNWFSTHADGTLSLYPMNAPNRRIERRPEVIMDIAKQLGLRVSNVLDFTKMEEQGERLEGTGSLVLDRRNRVAYAALSPRTTELALNEWGKRMGYETETLHAQDFDGNPVYHTNVLMSIGTEYAILCAEAIQNAEERDRIEERLESTGHSVVEITMDQMAAYAGNALEVRNNAGEKILAMSTRAFQSLTPDQITWFTTHAIRIVHSPIPTIENVGGGSMRCMMAAMHFPKA